MKYRILGKSKIAVSEVGLSCWAIGGQTLLNGKSVGWSNNNDRESYRALHKAFELGINYLDSAYVYGRGHADGIIGNFLSEVDRGRLVISTKIELPFWTRDNGMNLSIIRKQIEQNLINLRTDYIDILFLQNVYKQGEYLEGTIELIKKYQKEGKVRSIGLCIDEYSGLKKYYELVSPEVIQVHYNAFGKKMYNQLFQFADEKNLGIVLFTKAAHAIPTLNLNDETEHKDSVDAMSNKKLVENFRKLRRLKKEFGSTLEDLHLLALRVALTRTENCCILAGFKNVKQVELNAKATDEAIDINDIRKFEDIVFRN
ncbi:aldo/keto reductase [Bacillus wiedmannii]|uniref:aldo/keto reductase n=1 Tax=Bacillus wiedmannii TaxID=1890302 RepID=UPI000BEF5D8D|nr:aldo/keto reductase [Bacillus wiedmannii]PEL51556.1 hypothetical protein CN622_30220 [Bacillus wiedmannii]PEO05791.1 hypothetical protein CN562_29615 [Bacillus wiedmannii]PEP99149.1 hypothetical protein CN587_29745 [Bacillus wiedmannii]